MALSKKTQYNLKYAKEHVKRIPLDVSIQKYNEIKEASQQAGESVNGYIKKAIDDRLHNSKD